MNELTGMQPLSDFNVLETQNVDEARATMTSLYGDLTLTPLSQIASFALRLNAAPVGRLLISSMRWESPIEAHSPALDGCFDFCVALYGAAGKAGCEGASVPCALIFNESPVLASVYAAAECGFKAI